MLLWSLFSFWSSTGIMSDIIICNYNSFCYYSVCLLNFAHLSLVEIRTEYSLKTQMLLWVQSPKFFIMFMHAFIIFIITASNPPSTTERNYEELRLAWTEKKIKLFTKRESMLCRKAEKRTERIKTDFVVLCKFQ